MAKQISLAHEATSVDSSNWILNIPNSAVFISDTTFNLTSSDISMIRRSTVLLEMDNGVNSLSLSSPNCFFDARKDQSFPNFMWFLLLSYFQGNNVRRFKC